MRARWIGGMAAFTLAVALAAGITVANAATGTATLKTAKVSSLGTILVNGNGLTLYRFTADKKGSSSCTGGCAAAWPPLLLAGSTKPTAGNGVTASKLGTIKRANGQLQVTYGGYPLYRYAADTRPGQAKGEGIENSWYPVTPSGALVKIASNSTAATAATTTPSATTPGTPATSSPSATTTTPASTTGGGSYDY
jgi:predicted lipoprotein with Yx(FWY)xxD motif